MTDIIELADEILYGFIDPEPEQLVKILEAAAELFHNGEDEESFLDDSDYDKLERMLRSIDPTNPFLEAVGSNVRGGKIDLPFPMGSLDQVYEGETLEWVTKNGWLDELFIVSDKQDGTSALNIHKNGKLQIAYSRGNGYQGADITRHISKIKQFPQHHSENIVVRAEVIIPEGEFSELQFVAEQSGERVYKNARNYVAGRMNASESPEAFYKVAKVIATSIVEPKMGKLEQFETLASAGYEVTPYVVIKGHQLTDKWLEEYLTERRKLSPTAIDGLVIDLDNAQLRAALRRKSSSLNPMYSRKFKLGSSENVAIATVKKVHWEPSKYGYLKPRVEIEPIDLVGVTITYATGFNAKFIRDNKIGFGTKLQITRSGDVIPFIQKVIDPTTADMPLFTEYGEMSWSEGEVDLFIVDTANNRDVQLHLIDSVFSGLDVPFIRMSTIEKLYDAGYTSTLSIIKATEEELKTLIGESAGAKIYSGIRDKLNPVDFAILAGSTSLLGRGLGRRKMTKLVEALGYDCILDGSITVDQIITVDGFERKSAQPLVDNLPKLLQFLADLEGYYTLAKPKEKTVGGDLEGLTVVFTGVRDKDLESLIESRGGKIGSGVNKNTSFLIAKDPNGNSSKLVKARELIGTENVISITEAKTRWN